MTHFARGRVSVEVPGRPQDYQAIPLVGFETIGVVRIGGRAGALLRNTSTGAYEQVNAGKIHTLPQHKIVAALEDLRDRKV